MEKTKFFMTWTEIWFIRSSPRVVVRSSTWRIVDAGFSCGNTGSTLIAAR